MRLALLLALAVAVEGVAQEAGSAQAAGDKAAVSFNEIERGFFLAVSGGPSFILNAPASSGPRPFSVGQRGQVDVGVDLGPVLGVSAFAAGAANRAGANYIGYSGGRASGDFASLTVGGSARLSLLSFPDDQGVARTWVLLRGGLGYAMFFPAPLFAATDGERPLTDLVASAGAGVEYFTRLRHFSIGLEVSGQFMLASGTTGFSVTPTLRYAF